MSIQDPALDLATTKIVKFEGFSAAPYQDGGGIWTIGYGSTHCPDGTPVTENTPAITADEAFTWMRDTVEPLMVKVSHIVPFDITDNQLAALTSLAYNIGFYAFSCSTLLQLLNHGDLVGAAQQFLVWDKIHNVASKGLLNRRTEEKALFETVEV